MRKAGKTVRKVLSQAYKCDAFYVVAIQFTKLWPAVNKKMEKKVIII